MQWTGQHVIITAAQKEGSAGWFWLFSDDLSLFLSLPFPYLSPLCRSPTGLSPFYLLPRLSLPSILSGRLLH